MKLHFNIKYKEQILSGELSVITGSNEPVRIIYFDDDIEHNDYPVYGFIKEEKTMFRWNLDGHIFEPDIEPSNLDKFNYDLYLIKTSNELTEFEQHLECICEEYLTLGPEYDSWDKTDEWIRNKAAKLKETLLKEIPSKETIDVKFLPGHWYKCLQDFPDSPGMQLLFKKGRYYRASEEHENYMCYNGGAMYIPDNKKSVVFSLVEFEFTVGHWYKAVANWGDNVMTGQLWLCHKDGWLTLGPVDVRTDLGPNYFTPATDEEIHNNGKFIIGDNIIYKKGTFADVDYYNILGLNEKGYYAEKLKKIDGCESFVKCKTYVVIPLNHHSIMELIKN